MYSNTEETEQIVLKENDSLPRRQSIMDMIKDKQTIIDLAVIGRKLIKETWKLIKKKKIEEGKKEKDEELIAKLHESINKNIEILLEIKKDRDKLIKESKKSKKSKMGKSRMKKKKRRSKNKSRMKKKR